MINPLKISFFDKKNLDLSLYNNNDLKFLISMAYLYNIKNNEIGIKISKHMLYKKNIKKVYKEKAKLFHPDKETGSTNDFQELNDNKQIIYDYLKEYNELKGNIKNLNSKLINDIYNKSKYSFDFKDILNSIQYCLKNNINKDFIENNIKTINKNVLLDMAIMLTFIISITYSFNKDNDVLTNSIVKENETIVKNEIKSIDVKQKELIKEEIKPIIVTKVENPIIEKNNIVQDIPKLSYKDKNIDLSLLYKLNKLIIIELKKDSINNIINSDKYKDMLKNIVNLNEIYLAKRQLNYINELIKLDINSNELTKNLLTTNKKIESLMKLINPKKQLENNKKQELFFIEYDKLNKDFINSYNLLYQDLLNSQEDRFILSLQNEILNFIDQY